VLVKAVVVVPPSPQLQYCMYSCLCNGHYDVLVKAVVVVPTPPQLLDDKGSRSIVFSV